MARPRLLARNRRHGRDSGLASAPARRRVGEAVGSGVSSGFGDGLTVVPSTSVALTTSTRNCARLGRRPRAEQRLPGSLRADRGARRGASAAADPGVGAARRAAADRTRRCGAEPGVGELVEEDPCGAGEVESVSLGVVGRRRRRSAWGCRSRCSLADGVPVGVALGEPDGEQLGVPVGCGPAADVAAVLARRADEPMPLPDGVSPVEPVFVGMMRLGRAGGGSTDPPVLLLGEIAAGSAATANDAAVTTNSPVPTAAAGRSQPNQPGPVRIGPEPFSYGGDHGGQPASRRQQRPPPRLARRSHAKVPAEACAADWLDGDLGADLVQPVVARLDRLGRREQRVCAARYPARR